MTPLARCVRRANHEALARLPLAGLAQHPSDRLANEERLLLEHRLGA
jgi:hypothetical protein